MRLSICIPQYNRIGFLLRNLSIIEKQNFTDLEVVVSDDCSSDETEAKIKELAPNYKHRLIYHRFEQNQGYDRNFRKCIELASGEYVIVIGNDDSINPAYDLKTLEDFLLNNNLPDLGFTNFIEEETGKMIDRAKTTDLLGSGYETAMKYYSCFSFVGGLIYKKRFFEKFNSSKHDGSIYAQIYLGCLMTCSGGKLFSIKEPVVIKDIVLDEVKRDTYRDFIAKSWKDYKPGNGGLLSVINVLIDALRDAEVLNQARIYRVFKRIYSITFPFWILDYKSNKALPAAVGLLHGMKPTNSTNYKLLNSFNAFRIWVVYLGVGITALLMPVFLFRKLKTWLYSIVKK